MTESPKRGLLNAYGRLMGPLVRILIRNGVTFDEFAEIAKQSFVEVAGKHCQEQDEEASPEQLAKLTGFTASEVGSIEDQRQQRLAEAAPSYLDEIARLLHGWHTDSRFTGPYGIPMEL